MEEEEIRSLVSYKSGVWQHFGVYKCDGQVEKSNAICKMCHSAFKHTGSTTNMSSHLKRRHGVTVIERSRSPSTRSTPALANTSDGATKTPGEQSNNIPTFFHTPLASNLVQSKAMTEAISFSVCKDIQPYSITENEGFKYLLEVLEPRHSIPDRKVFTDRKIPALYDKVRRDIVDSMSRVKRVAVTIDGWASCATNSYITITAHYIDDEWGMQADKQECYCRMSSASGTSQIKTLH